jgi:hypothetical protein
LAAGVASVGQLLEHGIRGDEGFLSIEGIGPKALSEIKQALDKVLGHWQVADAAQPASSASVTTEARFTSAEAEETTEEAQQYFIEAMNEAFGETGSGDLDDKDKA